MTIDLERFLAPVPGDDPAGPDLAYPRGPPPSSDLHRRRPELAGPDLDARRAATTSTAGTLHPSAAASARRPDAPPPTPAGAQGRKPFADVSFFFIMLEIVGNR